MVERSGQVTTEQAISTPLSLSVTFTFDEQWKFGPANKLNGFPPGGGAGLLELVISPVHFEGLSAAEIAGIEDRRAGDMALLTQAIAAASVQFAAALKAAKR